MYDPLFFLIGLTRGCDERKKRRRMVALVAIL
jgi:hypothetical protein